MFEDFFWVGLPYIAFSFLVFGTLARLLFFERNWTCKSSQFLDKKGMRHALPIFHLGLLMVIGGHFVGIFIPQAWTEAVGVNEHLYHLGAVGGGMVGGTLLIVSFVLLMIRRFTNPYMRANTSPTDKVLYVFLGIALFTGFGCALSQLADAYNYRESIGPWFRSLGYLAPKPELMQDVPVLFKVHMFAWMSVAILFPFTRLVHCLSIPFNYLTRNPIIYRKR